MSLKTQEALVERRLKPIYDFLDFGSYKKVVQEADKLLKKHPDLSQLKGLKAIALVRLNKAEEALKLIDQIIGEVPTDLATLQRVTTCFKELGHPKRILEIYEAACKKVPANEELQSHLFMSAVRIDAFKRQQQMAMQMYKENPTNHPYYFWAVMSIYMQALENPNLAQTMLLPLAEKMIEKFIKENSVNDQPVLRLYLLVLNEQKKYVEALSVLNGPLGESLLPPSIMWDKQYVILETQRDLKLYEDVIDTAMNHLQTRSDDWRLWLQLVETTFLSVDSKPDQKSDLIGRISHFIMQQTAKNDLLNRRGPHIARLHFIRTLLEQDYIVHEELGTYQLGEPTTLLVDYFQRFSHKACCFSDLRPYLCLLGEQQKSEFIQQIEAIVGIPHKESFVSNDIRMAKNENHLQSHITAQLLARSLGFYKGDESIVHENLNRYLLTDDYVFEAFFNYLILAVTQLWETGGNFTTLIDIITILELGVKRQPENFHLKILLAKIFNKIGATECLLEIWGKLEIKSTQKDSLGYLLIDGLSVFGFHEQLVSHLDEVRSYFELNDRDLTDCLITAYKQGVFQRVPELVAYRKRCNRSLHKIAANVLRRYSLICTKTLDLDSICSFLWQMEKNPLEDAIDWSTLTDNRDFSILSQYDYNLDSDAGEAEKQNEIKNSFQILASQAHLAQLNLILLSYLRVEIELRTPKLENSACEQNYWDWAQVASAYLETEDKPGSGVTKIVSEIRSVFEASLSQATKHELFGPPTSHFYVYRSGEYFPLFDIALDLTLKFVKIIRDFCAEKDEKQAISLPEAQQFQHLIRGMVNNHQIVRNGPVIDEHQNGLSDNDSGGHFSHLQIVHLSYCLQTFAQCAHILIMLKKLLTVTQKSVKKKRKQGLGQINTLSDNLNEIIALFQLAIGSIFTLLDDLELIIQTEDLFISDIGPKSKLNNFVSEDFSKTISEIRHSSMSKIRRSYLQSVKQLKIWAANQKTILNNLISA